MGRGFGPGGSFLCSWGLNKERRKWYPISRSTTAPKTETGLKDWRKTSIAPMTGTHVMSGQTFQAVGSKVQLAGGGGGACGIQQAKGALNIKKKFIENVLTHSTTWTVFRFWRFWGLYSFFIRCCSVNNHLFGWTEGLVLVIEVSVLHCIESGQFRWFSHLF